MNSREIKEMKVLMITDTFPPMISGVADYTAILTKELANLGVRLTVATSKCDPEDTDQLAAGVKVLRVISQWKMADAKQIFQMIHNLGPRTIIHIQYGSGAYKRRPMINVLPLLIRMSKQDCPVVVTLHEFPRQLERLIYRIRTMPMLLAAQGLIIVDPADGKTLLRWTKFNKPRIECIPIASNIPPVAATDAQRIAWRRNLGLMGDVPVIVFFGGIHPLKGFHDLLEAITNLRQGDFPVRLLVIGGFEPWVNSTVRYQKTIREALKDGIEAGWVTLVDKSPADVVAKCLQASNIAAFPFINGASSNRGSILAAISQGIPVITTKGPDTPEGFEEQFGVALVPARDVSALSACIKSIIMSDERREQMKEKALKVSKELSWPAIARATKSFYISLIEKGVETR